MYFLGAAEQLSVETLMLISHFPPEASISVRSQRLFCTAICPLGANVLSVVLRQEVFWLKMYHFYGKINRGRIVCPLYGDSPYLGESVMGGSTVLCQHDMPMVCFDVRETLLTTCICNLQSLLYGIISIFHSQHIQLRHQGAMYSECIGCLPVWTAGLGPGVVCDCPGGRH